MNIVVQVTRQPLRDLPLKLVCITTQEEDTKTVMSTLDLTAFEAASLLKQLSGYEDLRRLAKNV